jgi:hypothetical protein
MSTDDPELKGILQALEAEAADDPDTMPPSKEAGAVEW